MVDTNTAACRSLSQTRELEVNKVHRIRQLRTASSNSSNISTDTSPKTPLFQRIDRSKTDAPAFRNNFNTTSHDDTSRSSDGIPPQITSKPSEPHLSLVSELEEVSPIHTKLATLPRNLSKISDISAPKRRDSNGSKPKLSYQKGTRVEGESCKGTPGFKAIVVCPTCQKIYSQRSLKFHSSICLARKKEEDRRRHELIKLEKLHKAPIRPPGKLCYICGRRYTMSSWQWHEPRCLKQWNTWNSRLPKSLQHKNGPWKPCATDEELMAMVESQRTKGNLKYTKQDAYDELMHDASRVNTLPLEFT
ncbi:unnamed protein product [Mesocestoides corti]|uniref:Uncharacterized protein n=1 Tax=Mesocestoides corti TaxID=53468 RepID=A0A0R3UKS9_MESCO|nr:unnamed protein product [Mesocestoides corti]